MQISGNIVDVNTSEIYPGTIHFGSTIEKIERSDKQYDTFILPGLIDAHIHIESSMLTPSRFAEAVTVHGTTAVVTDPHEIANVMGVEGIDFMQADAAGVPLKVFFTAPSCVPATDFETAGAQFDATTIAELLKRKEIVALGEMMNFPGVIFGVPEVLAKIRAAHDAGKPVDGHCPDLSREDLQKYRDAGITTEHECTTLEEAQEKASLGMKIMIREGSSAKNMDSLYKLAESRDDYFLVSDDIHANDLLSGHMNAKLRKMVALGINPLSAVKAASVNPANHYRLSCGLLKPDDPADLVIVNNLSEFKALRTYIDGTLVAENGKPSFTAGGSEPVNRFDMKKKSAADLAVKADIKSGSATVNVITVIEGQIVTGAETAKLLVVNGTIRTDARNDILKIAVAERYGLNKISVGFIKGFSLSSGAIASSVAHDSHNVVVVGQNDEDMTYAVNLLRQSGGGIAITDNGKILAHLPLPVAGLMSTLPVTGLAVKLKEVHDAAKTIGCPLHSPLMTLSFMALPVIPALKITDKGLFDVNKFSFTDLILNTEVE